ncbi:MAG: hypothetical protein HY906_21245 [Deltaproteobacteria bacterium]|nr:hypothetical protein [Deltaproteobacteria bacterium]
MKRCVTIFLAVAALLTASCSGDSTTGPADAGGDQEQQEPAQPPINITFDLHTDPWKLTALSPTEPELPLEQRLTNFRTQLENATWLLDTVEPYGGKISYLAVGPFWEFCAEDSEKDLCFPVLRRLYASGGMLSSHSHGQVWKSVNHWEQVPMSAGETEARQVFADVRRFADATASAALSLTSEADVQAVNFAMGSHVPADAALFEQLMSEYHYAVHQGGGGEQAGMYGLFGHPPWNVFRQDMSKPLTEDPAKYVVIPQGQVIGNVGEHSGVWQDGRVPHKQAEFLMLYVNWLYRSSTGQPPKVWDFGWGLHTQDIDPGSENRAAVEAIIPWLSQFVTEPGPTGIAPARFAGYAEVRDQYLAWEQEHPGVSSFNYAYATVDYSAYPYLEWANRYLRATDFDSEIPGPAGVRIFRLTAGGHALLLAVAAKASGVLDASSLGAATLRRVDLATGAATEVSAASAPVGPGSAVLCAAGECDAILALGESTGESCGGGPACPEGQVCATDVGRCVPDCRTSGFTCPADRPTCDATTGGCGP